VSSFQRTIYRALNAGSHKEVEACANCKGRNFRVSRFRWFSSLDIGEDSQLHTCEKCNTVHFLPGYKAAALVELENVVSEACGEQAATVQGFLVVDCPGEFDEKRRALNHIVLPVNNGAAYLDVPYLFQRHPVCAARLMEFHGQLTYLSNVEKIRASAVVGLSGDSALSACYIDKRLYLKGVEEAYKKYLLDW
jgi:hypothetical protein